MAREHAEHFCPWKPKAETATPSTAASMSASAATTIESFPPISATTRLIHFWPGCGLAASSLMCKPTSFDPVKEMKRICGSVTMTSPISLPDPGTKLTTPGGRPISSSKSTNHAAITAASLDGLSTTVFPETIAAAVIPIMMAPAKFQGGITAPTPRGMYTSSFCSPASGTTGCGCA